MATVSVSLAQRSLSQRVTACMACERLVRHREQVPVRASFRGQEYWRRPVPGFGDVSGWLLILGLAPAAHGGNRTGRVFTGDESGRFLNRVLFETGFASQPTSESMDDGMRYDGCYLTAAVKCAPPGDRPSREEFDACGRYLDEELELLTNVTSVVALGQMAFSAFLRHLDKGGVQVAAMEFAHGRRYVLEDGRALYASYHPSPRNTYTRRLTSEMLAAVFEMAKEDRRRSRLSG